MGTDEWDAELARANADATDRRAAEAAAALARADRTAAQVRDLAQLPEFMRWYIARARNAGLTPEHAPEHSTGSRYRQPVTHEGWWVIVDCGQDWELRNLSTRLFVTGSGRLFHRPEAGPYVQPWEPTPSGGETDQRVNFARIRHALIDLLSRAT